MDSLTNYPKEVLAVIADDGKFDEALDGMTTLHPVEFRNAIRKMLMNPYAGVAAISALMANEFQVILIEDAATETLAAQIH